MYSQLAEEDQVWDHLWKLDVHKSVGSNRMQSGVRQGGHGNFVVTLIN